MMRKIPTITVLFALFLLSSCSKIGSSVTSSGTCSSTSGQNQGQCQSVTTVVTFPPSANTLPQAANDYGATMAQWENNHTSDPQSPSNYWPKLSDGRDTYSQLQVAQNGLVDGFTYALYPAIALDLAESLALSLLPSGTGQSQVHTQGSCTQIVYSTFKDLVPQATFVSGGQNLVKSIIFSVEGTSANALC